MFKNIFSISVLCCMMFSVFSLTYAGAWKNNGNKVNFSTVVNTTIVTSCPPGEELVDNQQNTSGFPRNGQLDCMVKDYSAPIISVNTNGYTNNSWTNRNVTLNVSITDSGLWVKRSEYTINGAVTNNAGNTFTLSFTEEWVYGIKLWAEDNSTNASADGSSISNGNIAEAFYVVNIDKSWPLVTTSIVPPTSWTWSKPKISFAAQDNYKGLSMRGFTCTGKPSNASWLSPAWLSDGTFNGVCDANLGDCSLDANFTPNLSACAWACNTGYVKWNDNVCYPQSAILSCSSGGLQLPGSYVYNAQDALVAATGSESFSYWTAPLWVGPSTGLFATNFSTGISDYSPQINACNFDCRDGYHNESAKCVDNAAIVCCQTNYPLVEVGGSGPEVDCLNPANASHPSCMYNARCGGYVKDVMKYWDIDAWKYTDGSTIADNQASACGITPMANSNGFTCNARYYLVWSGTATMSCEPVPIGEYSTSSENDKHPCTNKPTNAYYTSNGSSNNCSWVCNANHSGGSCTANTQVASCTAKPANSVWNSVGSISQTWNGSSWTPSNTSTYNTSSSNSSCRFECATNYSWDGDSCNPDTRNVSCFSKPNHSNWNTVSNIEQTWDGNSWEPSRTPAYNTGSSTSECRFKCDSGYSWNGSSCQN